MGVVSGRPGPSAGTDLIQASLSHGSVSVATEAATGSTSDEQPATDIDRAVAEDVFERLIAQYINMRMGQWLRDVRERLKLVRTEALRKSHAGKQKKEKKKKLSDALKSARREVVKDAILSSSVSELADQPRAVLQAAFSYFPQLTFRSSHNRMRLAEALVKFVQDSPHAHPLPVPQRPQSKVWVQTLTSLCKIINICGHSKVVTRGCLVL